MFVYMKDWDGSMLIGSPPKTSTVKLIGPTSHLHSSSCKTITLKKLNESNSTRDKRQHGISQRNARGKQGEGSWKKQEDGISNRECLKFLCWGKISKHN